MASSGRELSSAQDGPDGSTAGAAAPARSPYPASFYRDPAGTARSDLAPRELAEIVRSGVGEVWVDIDCRDRHQHALLEKVFGFHPLAVEDTLNPLSRVKIEEYDGYLFVIIRGVRLDEHTDDPYDLETVNLNFFLGANYLVTVHDGPSRVIAAVTEQMRRAPELLSRGAERLMHAIMDTTIDMFFPVVEQVDEFTQAIEERVFVHADSNALHDIFSVKRLVLQMRRYLGPQREIFNILSNRPTPLLRLESQIYFRDIYDHVLRINEALETYRDLLTSVLDAYLTQVSNRLNVATKGLTVVATLSIPFVVVSGMWGMNFARIPLASAPYGFWWMVGAQLVIGLVLLGVLRWRRWV
ncbi:MAG TPA: magnesium/cobalt transporter CorA [Gemmatimonadaceae bacterium]|nr:magnesium/cobalt transporter CorA [Gemmatimonadaceae bacterium]